MSSMRNEACPCHFIQGLAPQLWKGGSRHIYKPLVKDFNCSEWVRLPGLLKLFEWSCH